MNENIEKNLRMVVEVSTRKAAIEEWRDASEKQLVPLYNYRLDHIEEVVDLAKHIASGTDVNMDVVILAAWLHDLAKPGIGGIPAQHHGIASAKLAENILPEEGVNPEIITQVSDVIRKHVGLTLKKPLEPIEAQILWEADKILKLGVIGFIQYILNGVRIEPGRSLNRIAESLREFLHLASDIAQCMVTERGQELAQERLKTLRELSKYLDGELTLVV
ncbi:MAG: HD domain-containing protein [Candidatus Thorarchaeota archaeon]|nr:HD domain-containing protein [Candidatus Thorarchaeota archaeon]